ncbi:MAG: hypothetical protein QM766_25550 [Burkholderiaceae bacterium]
MLQFHARDRLDIGRIGTGNCLTFKGLGSPVKEPSPHPLESRLPPPILWQLLNDKRQETMYFSTSTPRRSIARPAHQGLLEATSQSITECSMFTRRPTIPPQIRLVAACHALAISLAGCGAPSSGVPSAAAADSSSSAPVTENSPPASASDSSGSNAKPGDSTAATDSSPPATVSDSKSPDGKSGGSGGVPESKPSENSLLLTNPTNATINDYPLEIGRVFKKGEIASCPYVYVNNVRVPAQIDVKNRWNDGSLRFAVVSTVLSSIRAAERLTMDFRPGAICTSASGPSTNELLTKFDFDTRIILNDNDASSASARSMLATLPYRRWTDGPINTTAIIEDHIAKRYDFGTDSNNALRPIFHVQFWPTAHVYRVRVIVEQSDTTKLQSQDYSVRVTVGKDAPKTVYEKNAVPHAYGTRWTRDFWVGRDLPELSIQHNVAYLTSTQAIPNYDSTITLSQDAKAKLLNLWNSKPTDIYDAGLWQRAMPTTGGRADIGLLPSWHLAALYDGDAALWRMVRRQSDLAAAWPAHFRIGDSRIFDESTGAAGQGRVATRDSHPTQFLHAANYYLNNAGTGVKSADSFNVTASPKTAWIVDGAHQPDPWYLTYLVTGEWWYLEQLQFWASWGTFDSNPSSACWGSGRSPKDAIIQDEVRGDAWLLRARARAAFASPDNSPEQAYFSRITESVLRAWEGMRIGTGADPLRAYWAKNRCKPPSDNPLHVWTYAPSDGGYTSGGPPDMKSGTAPWMQHFVIAALGHVRELGFDSGELLSWTAKFSTGIATDPGSDPRHLADYFVPTTQNSAGNPFFLSWSDAFDDWTSWQESWIRTRPDLEHGYTNIATAAVSFITDQTNGLATWNWVHENNYATQDWASNPKWAIRPR